MADKIPQFRRKTSGGYQILQEGNPFQVPDNKIQENITVTPSNERQTLYAALPYNGVHEILVKSVTEADSALRKENIAKDITIFGITGTHGEGPVAPDLYDGDVTLTTNPQIFNPEGHDGFSSIKVSANISSQGTTSSPYTISSIDSLDKDYATIHKKSDQLGMSQAVIKLHSDLEPYIKKDTKILGVTGKYEGESPAPSLGTKTVDPSTSLTTYNASADSLDGYSSFTVKAIQTETKSGDASASSDVTINSTSGKYMTSFTINKVRATEDSVTKDITSNMIRKDVTILGINGSYEGSSLEDNRNITSSQINFKTTDTVTINPSSSSYAGMKVVTINKDPNLLSKYIRQGITIFGIEGRYAGGADPVDLFNMDETGTGWGSYAYTGYYISPIHINIGEGGTVDDPGEFTYYNDYMEVRIQSGGANIYSPDTPYLYLLNKVTIPSGATKLMINVSSGSDVIKFYISSSTTGSNSGSAIPLTAGLREFYVNSLTEGYLMFINPSGAGGSHSGSYGLVTITSMYFV